MRTIRDVFSSNVRRLRGDRSQAEIAEAAGIPFRTYQGAEYGAVPKEENLAAIAKALGCHETELFLDPDLSHPPVPDQLAEIARQSAREAALEVLDMREPGMTRISVPDRLTAVQRRDLEAIAALLSAWDDDQRDIKLELIRRMVVRAKQATN